MCGFAGFLGFSALGAKDPSAIARRMGDSIRHRGPDDSGVWHDGDGQIALVHQRLSILDLSTAGHQPMVSQSGRHVIVFNGEIYNHVALRKELESFDSSILKWRGHSDTETLLAGIDTWGLQSTLVKAKGMFSIAVWDRHTRVLSLARDRLGEKPLYFGWQGQGQRSVFLFGSELSALKQHPQFAAPIDRGSLALLMRHSYVPAPHSIHEGIAKLEPGTLLQVSLTSREPRLERYWDFIATSQVCRATPFIGSPEQAVEELEALLKEAIGQQMVADVPLGAFLSGGIDSSTVVALMQARSSRPVKTFTIGFHEEGYDEAKAAQAVATHLGTDHTELYVTPEMAMQVIPSLPGLYSEPFADSSQIPTFLVSQLARSQVTVSLSGDGGDELFAGYDRYQFANLWQSRLRQVPVPLRWLAGRRSVRSLAGLLQPWGPKYLGQNLELGVAMLAAHRDDGLYRLLLSHVTNPCDWVRQAEIEPTTAFTERAHELDGLTSMERMMALDTVSYLPDDILVKVDRAAMGASLESRIPFLDHQFVEFAWRLPLEYKLRNGITKWPLRQVLARYVPHALVDRPKRGFSIPVHEWLRGPLRDWAENLLSKQRLEAEGYFYAKPIRQAWAEHLQGKRNWSSRLWIVLMFQAWMEQQQRLDKGELSE
jgi:asparagine synthase (glutamine-hydrolysing)